MADGTKKPIEQVKVGDKVLSRDQNGGKVVAKKVKQTFVHQVLTTRLLTLKNGEKIETTPGHRFFVEGIGWQKAKEFGLGTSIVTRAGPAVALSHVEDKHHDTPVAVYNFEVEDTHTYFVGNSELWAHNQTPFNLGFGTHAKGFRNAVGGTDYTLEAGDLTNAQAQEFIEGKFSGPLNFNTRGLDPSWPREAPGTGWEMDEVINGRHYERPNVNFYSYEGGEYTPMSPEEVDDFLLKWEC